MTKKTLIPKKGPKPEPGDAVKSFDFKDVFTLNNEAESDSFLAKKYAATKKRVRVSETPDFPYTLGIEITNVCNQKCLFCGLDDTDRPGKMIDPNLFKDIVRQCYELGSREISLVGSAEPLANKRLEEHIAFCKELGFDYIFITTNGTLATLERWQRLIDAGLDSIKISIHGADRETYKAVHGRDEFDKAIRSVHAISEYKKTLERPLFLGVACVETTNNKGSFEALKEMLGPYVDELVGSQAIRPPGHRDKEGVYLKDSMGDVVNSGKTKCYMPFSQAIFSAEGYFRACCVEWGNATALEDVKEISVADAWVSERFKSLRRRLIAESDGRGNLKGLLCEDCLYGGSVPFGPMNPNLSNSRSGKN